MNDLLDTMMHGAKSLQSISGSLRAASASIEERFLDIADRLEKSVDTVASLTAAFDTLSGELAGRNLQQATNDLVQIATRVSGLARSQGAELASFVALSEGITGIESRITRIHKSIEGVGALSVNAKITAACINGAGVDFLGFAGEINRTLQLGELSLKQFSAELGGAVHLLRAAIDTQSDLEASQTAAVRSIPARLGQSTEAIKRQGDRVIAAALDVSEASQRIGLRIGSAVMALQIGDITRQRMEHVDYALGLILEKLHLENASKREGDGISLEPIGAERDAMVGLFCRLQSAQLEDAADSFDREVQQISSSLQALGADASEILLVGNDAFSASGGAPGTFVGELEGEVGEVNQLLGSFRKARDDAEQVAASVSEATRRLTSHIGTVRSLESDIHIMGLNMTFKCGRLGVMGRPIGVIAQELRLYAKEITGETNKVMTDLDRVVLIADTLPSNGEVDATADIASIADLMANTLSRLAAAGRGVTDALQTLDRGGNAVTGVLREAVLRTNIHEEIGRVLRQAAADLKSIGSAHDDDLGPLPKQAEEVLELFMSSYTMDRERMILSRHIPGWSSEMQPTGVPMSGPIAADLDDIFF